MKILHIASSYYPAFEFGGPIESVHQLNKWLAKKGVEVTVYTTNAGLRSRQFSFKKETNLDGVKVFYFPYYGYVHFTFSPSLFVALVKNAKKFDLIHITGIWNFPVGAAAFWARFYKKPYIISPRGSLMKEPLEVKSSLKKKVHLFLIGKRDLKNAAAIHFTTEVEKEEYLKAGLLLKKAIVIPNALDTDDFDIKRFDFPGLSFRKKFNIPADKKVVLFLSRLNWKKGLDTLIPAFAEVLENFRTSDVPNIDVNIRTSDVPGIVLVIAGPDEKNYKKEIELKIENCKLKIGKDVIFTGMLLGEDKIAAYKESDVFVLPSYAENFGMAVVEAMHFKVPVVVTEGVGIAPEIKKAGAGLVVKKDSTAVAEAILKILNSPDLGREMGKAGKKLVEEEFSSEKVAGKWVQVYNELIR